MPRSAVLSGRIDARDRAHQRHRRDRGPAPAIDPTEWITHWLAAADLPRDAAGIRRFDLARYLRETSTCELVPEERLRQLAIFFEDRTGERCAIAIDRVYEEALRLAPDDALVWHSRSITLKQRDEARYLARARIALDRANELAPEHPAIRYSLGNWSYFHGGGAAEALPLFDRTLEVEPEHAYAWLYRAHCLHDLARWPEAIDAYDATPLAAFTGYASHLVDVVLECVSYCRLRAGDREGAILGFSRLIARLDADPQRGRWLDLAILRRVAEGELREELR